MDTLELLHRLSQGIRSGLTYQGRDFAGDDLGMSVEVAVAATDDHDAAPAAPRQAALA